MGLLNHVRFSSVFNAEDRKKLMAVLRRYQNGKGFTGLPPGSEPGERWNEAADGSAVRESLRQYHPMLKA
jgi:hypothetical protein